MTEGIFSGTDDSDLEISRILEGAFERTHDPETDDAAVLLLPRLLELPHVGQETKVVFLAGGAGAGKGSLVKEVTGILERKGYSAATVGTDAFVKGDRAFRRANLEHGEATGKYDKDYLNALVSRIVKNRDPRVKIPLPKYDDLTGVGIAAGEESFPDKTGPVDFFIIEGDFDFLDREDLCVYLHVPDAVRLAKRIERDTRERNESAESLTKNFLHRQANQHFPYTLPIAKKADLVLWAEPDVDGRYLFRAYERRAASA